MSNCLSCSSRLLRHFGQGKVYWYCQCCRQEMPNFLSIAENRDRRQQLERLLSFSCLEQIALNSKPQTK